MKRFSRTPWMVTILLVVFSMLLGSCQAPAPAATQPPAPAATQAPAATRPRQTGHQRQGS